MTLDSFLRRTATTSKDFALKLGASVHAINKWRRGARIPRAGMLMKIEKITKGAVSAADWYK